MSYLLIGAAVLAYLYWRSRLRGAGWPRWRGVSGLSAIATLAAAAFTAARGGELKSLVLLVLALGLAAAARWGSVRPRPGPDGMSEAEARETLGVETGAGEMEIREAYARLIRRVHPDHGGASGLAAQLNRARDVLLRRTRS